MDELVVGGMMGSNMVVKLETFLKELGRVKCFVEVDELHAREGMVNKLLDLILEGNGHGKELVVKERENLWISSCKLEKIGFLK